MLKRRSSVSNCCRIQSSNRLNLIFIKFNFFIYLNIFVRGARAPGALSLDPPLSGSIDLFWLIEACQVDSHRLPENQTALLIPTQRSLWPIPTKRGLGQLDRLTDSHRQIKRHAIIRYRVKQLRTYNNPCTLYDCLLVISQDKDHW